jgi:hypothetical protein
MVLLTFLSVLVVLPACWSGAAAGAGSPDAAAEMEIDTFAENDTDSESETEPEPDCESEPLPDIDDIADCPMQWGWPCSCQITDCDNGLPCIGVEYDLGICASLCQLEDPPSCPEIGPFGMEVVELCGTYLDPDGCVCLLEGCDGPGSCPYAASCVEPSCLADYPGCPEGDGEVKVCGPSNY